MNGRASGGPAPPRLFHLDDLHQVVVELLVLGSRVVYAHPHTHTHVFARLVGLS